MIYPSQPARFPAPLRTSLPENKQHQVCRSSSCHRSETALCKTTAWSSRPESRSDSREGKTPSEQERGKSDLRGKALWQGLKRSRATPSTPHSHTQGWGIWNHFFLQVCFEGKCPVPVPFSSCFVSSDFQSCSCPVSMVLKPHSQILPDTRCLATVLCKCLQFQPSVGRGRSGSCIFFKRTVSALKKALEISMFSRSLSSHLGFGFCRFIPPLVIFLEFKYVPAVYKPSPTLP